jgi:UDPglucose--hexose-1-phosphate uridylyltransferase
MNNLEFTHRRRNLLTGDWVLVSPHRNDRPWLGAQEKRKQQATQQYDPTCPLCPNNSRANNAANPDYVGTHVFKNDFGALTSEAIDLHKNLNTDAFFEFEPSHGECRVICYSAEHNKTLPDLTLKELNLVVETWQREYIELSQTYSCVHIFENKGEVMGCSQPHSHGQIWAHDHYSSEILKEDHNQKAYFSKHNRSLLADCVTKERGEQTRIVVENDDWLVIVPFWAAWPFETLLIAKSEVPDLGRLTLNEKNNLAKILKDLTQRYDKVFNCSFPYSMGWHNAPSDLDDNAHWRLHAHFYPPLLRSETVKKFMVGYEMLAEGQRDLTAETAAKILRDICI